MLTQDSTIIIFRIKLLKVVNVYLIENIEIQSLIISIWNNQVEKVIVAIVMNIKTEK